MSTSGDSQSSTPEDIEGSVDEILDEVAESFFMQIKSSPSLANLDIQIVMKYLAKKMKKVERANIVRNTFLENTIENEFTQTALGIPDAESVGDNPMYICVSECSPNDIRNITVKWFLTGDTLENGLQFLFEGPPPHCIVDSTAIIIGSKLYTMGGLNWNKFCRTPITKMSSRVNNHLYMKDLQHRDSTWTCGPPMIKARLKPHAAFANGRLYVFGSASLLDDLVPDPGPYPWAECLKSPMCDNVWGPVRDIDLHYQTIAYGHAVSDDGKKIVLYSPSTDSLLIYDVVKDCWILHAVLVSTHSSFTAVTFMDGIMYGAEDVGKQNINYDILAFDFSKPKSQKKVIIHLVDLKGTLGPWSLLPVGRDMLYVLVGLYEYDTFWLTCHRYRILKEMNSYGEMDITAVFRSQSEYKFPEVNKIVSVLAA